MARRPKPKLVDLRRMDLSYEDDSRQKIVLLDFKTAILTLDTAIYKNGEFVENREMVYAHLPKKLKGLLNKFF
ncbi:MAG: malate dehydrogenase [Campylobacterales bacterium]|nr:malate dehydrogenase [Campylobacterales bacterium]NQY54385.1 malate dehydrogenase [Campylobacteraceae bacterium]